MPEPPDFDQIARKILHPWDDPTDPLWMPSLQMAAEELRQIWNARGAADLAAVESPFMGLGPFREKVRDAIRTLDR
jgi:hypothetical protein